MTTRQVPSIVTSNWPQQYQPIGTPANNRTKMNTYDRWMRGETANFRKINQNNRLWFGFDRYHNRVNYVNNTNILNNMGRVLYPIASAEGVFDTPAVTSSLITSSAPAISVTTLDTDQPVENNLLAEQLKPVSGFLAEKPTQFNPLIESPKNDLHKKVRNLLDLKSNVTPYSWQTESPLTDRSDKYLNREIHDHFMQYDLKKNHCVTCGFQTKLEQF